MWEQEPNRPAGLEALRLVHRPTQSFPGNGSAGDMVDVHDCRVLDMDLLCPTSLGFVQRSVLLQCRFLHTSCVSGRWSLSPY